MKTDLGVGARLAATIARRAFSNSRLPKDIAREAAAYACRRHSDGVSQVKIAHELGVSAITIGRWLAGGSAETEHHIVGDAKRSTKMRAVHVVDTVRPATTSIVATTRDGLRVEGLTVVDLIAVLRGLG